MAELRPLVPAKHNGFMEHNKEFGALVADFAGACFQNAHAIRKTARADSVKTLSSGAES